MYKNLIILLLSLIGVSLYGQTTTAGVVSQGAMASSEQVQQVLSLSLITIIILLFVVIVLALSIKTLIVATLPPTAHALQNKASSASWWDRFKGVAPSPGKEMDRDLGHVYDGIQELDNDMPPWFIYLFYTTILFAALYTLNFHILKWSPLQADEYTAEIETAAREQKEIQSKKAALIDENNVTLTQDQSALAIGHEIYEASCASCHGKAGEGLVGPNLTDEFWLHGGGIKNTFKTIKYGVPDKGMISWQTQLTPAQMQAVASVILGLKGSNPPNQKDPQGELWTGDSIVAPTEMVVDTLAAHTP
jgi:cytochrome c oxidase cbb3-type subunit 3